MKRPTRRARVARPHDVRVGQRWKPTVAHLSRWTAWLGSVATVVRTFYSNRRAWLALLASAVILSYGGGAVLFWFHAIYLGEGGPAVSPWLHWVLDSTAGFVGLTPPIAVILPLAAWMARLPAAVSEGPDGSAAVGTQGVHPLRFAVVGGALMAVVTAPGPFLHDLLVARGTFIGDQAERWFGNGDEPTGSPQEVTWLVEAAQQVGAGLPVYATMFVVAWLVVHRVVHWRASVTSMTAQATATY